MFHNKKTTITYASNCTLKQVLAYALTIKIKKKKPTTTNGTALKWDVTRTKSSTPLIMNEISQSQLTVFYQLFSSRNTCEKVPHPRLCSGKSLHSAPSAAFCERGEGRTTAIGFFRTVRERKFRDRTVGDVNNSCVMFSAPLIIDLTFKGPENHCHEMELDTRTGV